MFDTWRRYMDPFCIFGNLYFVGTRDVCNHIIDTGDGLILIDSGFPQSLYLLTESIRRLGFDPADIKYILHSHGHYDHIGGTRALVELYGAKTVIGRPDRTYANGQDDLTYAKELGFEFIQCFEPDILLDDGDILALGNTKIRAVATPGHTPGTMSFFFDITDGKNIYTAGMLGGAGMNSMMLDFLKKYDLPLSLRDDFLRSLDKLKDEKVDITIGNHVGDVHVDIKYAEIKAGKPNPFIDPTAWNQGLEYRRGLFYEMVAAGK